MYEVKNTEVSPSRAVPQTSSGMLSIREDEIWGGRTRSGTVHETRT